MINRDGTSRTSACKRNATTDSLSHQSMVDDRTRMDFDLLRDRLVRIFAYRDFYPGDVRHFRDNLSPLIANASNRSRELARRCLKFVV